MKRGSFPGFTVGVTGGIGSGKSAVCSILAGLGRPVIAADPLARNLMETDPEVRMKLGRLLGDEIFTPEGKLQRGLVASKIFGDKHILKKVNAIVHPAVIEATRKLLEGIPHGQRAPYSVIEAALVYESGMDQLLDAVIVVDAPLEVRIARVVERVGGGRDDVINRARAQMDPEVLKKRADFVIRNVESPKVLGDRVTFIHELLSSISMQQRSA